MAVDIFLPTTLQTQMDNYLQSRGKYDLNYKDTKAVENTLYDIPYSIEDGQVLTLPLYTDETNHPAGHDSLYSTVYTPVVCTSNGKWQNPFVTYILQGDHYQVTYINTIAKVIDNDDYVYLHNFRVRTSETTDEDDSGYQESLQNLVTALSGDKSKIDTTSLKPVILEEELVEDSGILGTHRVVLYKEVVDLDKYGQVTANFDEIVIDEDGNFNKELIFSLEEYVDHPVTNNQVVPESLVDDKIKNISVFESTDDTDYQCSLSFYTKFKMSSTGNTFSPLEQINLGSDNYYINLLRKGLLTSNIKAIGYNLQGHTGALLVLTVKTENTTVEDTFDLYHVQTRLPILGSASVTVVPTELTDLTLILTEHSNEIYSIQPNSIPATNKELIRKGFMVVPVGNALHIDRFKGSEQRDIRINGKNREGFITAVNKLNSYEIKPGFEIKTSLILANDSFSGYRSADRTIYGIATLKGLNLSVRNHLPTRITFSYTAVEKNEDFKLTLSLNDEEKVITVVKKATENEYIAAIKTELSTHLGNSFNIEVTKSKILLVSRKRFEILTFTEQPNIVLDDIVEYYVDLGTEKHILFESGV